MGDNIVSTLTCCTTKTDPFVNGCSFMTLSVQGGRVSQQMTNDDIMNHRYYFNTNITMRYSTAMHWMVIPISDYVPLVVGDNIYQKYIYINKLEEKNIFIYAVQGQVSPVLVKFWRIIPYQDPKTQHLYFTLKCMHEMKLFLRYLRLAFGEFSIRCWGSWFFASNYFLVESDYPWRGF